MNLFDIPLKGRAKITKINVTGNLAARMQSLGLCAGAEVRTLAYSLFGTCVLVQAGGARISVRKKTARLIEVEI